MTKDTVTLDIKSTSSEDMQKLAKALAGPMFAELQRAAKCGYTIPPVSGYHGGASARRIAMQNDLDLTRKILESIRDRQDLKYRTVSLAGYDADLVGRHVERLFDDGMLDGTKQQLISDDFARVAVRDLTTAGHNFLAALESGDTWARLKSALSPSELGALSMKKLAGLAGEIAEKAIRKKLGLD